MIKNNYINFKINKNVNLLIFFYVKSVNIWYNYI